MESAKVIHKDSEHVRKKKKFGSIANFEQNKIKPQRKRRYSLDKQKILILCNRSPISPNSSYFQRPKESPEYLQLNILLSKLNSDLSFSTPASFFTEQSEKPISMLNTSCSSLLQRRNKSQKSFRLLNLLKH